MPTAHSWIRLGLLVPALFLLLPAVQAGAAGPTSPVTVSAPPTGQGDAFVPGTREVVGYVEEEFLISGAATLYSYAHDPPLGPTDTVAVQDDVPYTTRIIVRRPEEPGEYNGTVVIEWWNSTAGFDTAPVWDASAEYFKRTGTIYVGVTNSTTSLGFLVGGCRLFGFLPPTCGTRYATLSLPENGVAFEMVSQIANLLKGGSPQNPIPANYPVDRLYHAGQSQQGGSLITYASGFHFSENDGYFVQEASRARPINFGPACGAQGSDPFPDCTPRLQGDDRLVRTDLPVPVAHAMTELDIRNGQVARQDDTPTFRYYEVAGGSHLTVHKDVELIPAGILGPDPLFLEDLCQFEINSTADGPVFFSYVLNALWEAMEQQVQHSTKRPGGVLMDVDGGVIQRDEFGNGLGGVRLPSMEVPIATYTPGNQADPNLPPFLQQIGNLACFLAGSVVPFDDATLDELYPTKGGYVRSVAAAARRLMRDGLLLGPDAGKINKAAAASSIGTNK